MAEIRNTESDTLLSGTNGNDSINNYGNYVSINSGADND